MKYINTELQQKLWFLEPLFDAQMTIPHDFLVYAIYAQFAFAFAFICIYARNFTHKIIN